MWTKNTPLLHGFSGLVNIPKTIRVSRVCVLTYKPLDVLFSTNPSMYLKELIRLITLTVWNYAFHKEETVSSRISKAYRREYDQVLKLVRNINHTQGSVSYSMCYPPSLEYTVSGNRPSVKWTLRRFFFTLCWLSPWYRSRTIIASSKRGRASQEILEEVRQKVQYGR